MARELTRWNPFREMVNMQNQFDRFFDDWRPFFNDENLSNRTNFLAIDAHEDDTQYNVTTELPGVNPENINVRQDGDYLLIEADIPEETSEREDKRWLIRERRSGHFSRRIRLPQNVDFDKAEANYHDGVLTLSLPKSEKARPHQIPVKTSNGNTSGNGNAQPNTVSGTATNKK
jgi:HSP20 family protein